MRAGVEFANTFEFINRVSSACLARGMQRDRVRFPVPIFLCMQKRNGSFAWAVLHSYLRVRQAIVNRTTFRGNSFFLYTL